MDILINERGAKVRPGDREALTEALAKLNDRKFAEKRTVDANDHQYEGHGVVLANGEREWLVNGAAPAKRSEATAKKAAAPAKTAPAKKAPAKKPAGKK